MSLTAQDVRSPMKGDLSIKEKVIAEVRNAGPLLSTVNLTKGLKENKVLLPCETFERLVDTMQFSLVPDPKKCRSSVKSYRVVGKPQDVQQIARRFPFPADRAGLREEVPARDVKPQLGHGRKVHKESAGLTEADFLAIRQPKGPSKEEASAKKSLGDGKPVQPHYCNRHKPHPDVLPSTVRDAVGFPSSELLHSFKQLQMARSGESHVAELDPGPDLAQALPIIGLYNPNDRVPLRCGWKPLELADRLAVTAPTSESPLPPLLQSPAEGSDAPKATAPTLGTTLGFFVTTAQHGEAQVPKSPEVVGLLRIPVAKERRFTVIGEDGIPQLTQVDDGGDVVTSSLFANDFQGMKAIILALDDVCPPLMTENLNKKLIGGSRPDREEGVPAGGSDDEEAEGEAGDSSTSRLSKTTGDRRSSKNKAVIDEENCVVCVARAHQQVLRRKADVDSILTNPTDKDTMLGDWKGMFVNSKLKCNEDLLNVLQQRQHTRDAVYQSPVHLGQVTHKAVDDACQWSLSRSFSHDVRRHHGNANNFTLWAEAGVMLRNERAHASASILFYKRLSLFLDALRTPIQEAQVALVASVRQFLIAGGQVQKQLLFRILAQAGPSVLESREIMKVIHFIRMELRVTLEQLIQWVRARPRKQQGWKLTSDLVALWDKIRTNAHTEVHGTVRSRQRSDSSLSR
eukprot:GGOE01020927.1.p1 GENE.GGOE01020927.1~~GGOE01020927.1.p1  ORF type:complete len:685 (+),score=191.14 GGOE01020927.1:49-2103(+)